MSTLNLRNSNSAATKSRNKSEVFSQHYIYRVHNMTPENMDKKKHKYNSKKRKFQLQLVYILDLQLYSNTDWEKSGKTSEDT